MLLNMAFNSDLGMFLPVTSKYRSSKISAVMIHASMFFMISLRPAAVPYLSSISFGSSCLMISFFKLFNDRYSHMIGDLVLHEVAQLCQEVVRDTDLVARYGGEEFVILLPETALDGALMVADRLREQVADTVIQTSAGDLTITISLGVHQADLQHDDLSRLISAADEAMLAAKRSGRNRVEVK